MAGDGVVFGDAAGILEVAKALGGSAKILEDVGDHQMATASRNEAGALLRGCADLATAQTLLTAAPRSKAVAVSARNHACTRGEELTPKELDVLGLLATRLSRREIGQRLYVSLNTVKPTNAPCTANSASRTATPQSSGHEGSASSPPSDTRLSIVAEANDPAVITRVNTRYG